MAEQSVGHFPRPFPHPLTAFVECLLCSRHNRVLGIIMVSKTDYISALMELDLLVETDNQIIPFYIYIYIL